MLTDRKFDFARVLSGALGVEGYRPISSTPMPMVVVSSCLHACAHEQQADCLHDSFAGVPQDSFSFVLFHQIRLGPAGVVTATAIAAIGDDQGEFFGAC